MRQEGSVERAFLVKTQNNNVVKNKKKKKYNYNKLGGFVNNNNNNNKKKATTLTFFHLAPIAKKPIIHRKSASGGQMQDVINVVN